MNTQELERFELVAPRYDFPAAIVARAVGQQLNKQWIAEHVRAFGSSEDVSPEDLFTWAAVISNQRLDSWFTKMANSSLQNYAEDAKAGVAFLNSHRHAELPVGYSMNGTFEADGTPAESYPRVIADFYTVRGINISGLHTDQFIKGVQFGLVRDVSIGFKEGEGFRYTCSVCGEDFFSWDCFHIPGASYNIIENPDAEPSERRERTVTAFAWVDNARLSEVSAVYDGATPDAMVVKATRELRAGRLKPDVLRMLETTYRIEVPRTTKTFAGIDPTPEEREVNMEKEEKGTSGAPDNRILILETQLRSYAKSLNLTGVSISEATTAEAALDAIRTELDRLRPLEAQAIEGQELRKALIEDTIKEGVRAFGDKFDKDARSAMLSGLAVSHITEMRSSWKEIADAAFANTERKSEDDPGDEDEVADHSVPVEASGGV